MTVEEQVSNETFPDLVWVHGDLGYWVTDPAVTSDLGLGPYFQPVARQEGDGTYDWSGNDGWPDASGLAVPRVQGEEQ